MTIDPIRSKGFRPTLSMINYKESANVVMILKVLTDHGRHCADNEHHACDSSRQQRDSTTSQP